MYKIVKVIKGNPDGTVLIIFWADHLNEWLQCSVPQHYRLTTAPEYLARAARPPVLSEETRRARASHLAGFRKHVMNRLSMALLDGKHLWWTPAYSVAKSTRMDSPPNPPRRVSQLQTGASVPCPLLR